MLLAPPAVTCDSPMLSDYDDDSYEHACVSAACTSLEGLVKRRSFKVGETKAYQNGCLMPDVYINNAKKLSLFVQMELLYREPYIRLHGLKGETMKSI